MTGHIFFAERWYGFDDAILAALRLMAATVTLGESITDLRSAMPMPVRPNCASPWPMAIAPHWSMPCVIARWLGWRWMKPMASA
jgi:hypothetical protein